MLQRQRSKWPVVPLEWCNICRMLYCSAKALAALNMRHFTLKFFLETFLSIFPALKFFLAVESPWHGGLNIWSIPSSGSLLLNSRMIVGASRTRLLMHQEQLLVHQEQGALLQCLYNILTFKHIHWLSFKHNLCSVNQCRRLLSSDILYQSQ